MVQGSRGEVGGQRGGKFWGEEEPRLFDQLKGETVGAMNWHQHASVPWRGDSCNDLAHDLFQRMLLLSLGITINGTSRWLWMQGRRCG